MNFPSSTAGKLLLAAMFILAGVLLVLGLSTTDIPISFTLYPKWLAALGAVLAAAIYGYTTPSKGATWDERFKNEGQKFIAVAAVIALTVYGVGVTNNGKAAGVVALIALAALIAEIGASMLGARIIDNQHKEANTAPSLRPINGGKEGDGNKEAA